MPKRPGSSNTLRIIGGTHRGRKLQFPDSKGLRPTADRVRETLFNWLQNDIAGSHCLDLFAGSGALGFEAVSRGAAYVAMVEAAGPVVSRLKDNVALLGEQQKIEVFQAKAEQWLQNNEKRFDILFLDPPFADDSLDYMTEQLIRFRVLKDNALVYIERDVKQSLPDLPSDWHLQKDKRSGQVAYSLFSLEG